MACHTAEMSTVLWSICNPEQCVCALVQQSMHCGPGLGYLQRSGTCTSGGDLTLFLPDISAWPLRMLSHLPFRFALYYRQYCVICVCIAIVTCGTSDISSRCV